MIVAARRLALPLLLVLAGQPTARATSSPQVPVDERHFLNARFAWLWNPPPTDGKPEIRARIHVQTADGMPSEMSPHARRPSPLNSFLLIGKWWPILDDFIKNVGVIWTYRDVFYVEDEAGTTYKLDRKALSKYPDLLRRLRNATISFDRMEVSVEGIIKGGSPVPIIFCLTGADFLFFPEGATPYMAAPGGQLTWSESVRMGHPKMDPQDNKSLYAQWTKLVAVRDPIITITGLRIPEGELVAIANAYEEREKKDKDLEKEIAALEPDAPLPGDVGHYRGGDEAFAEPFEETGAQAHRDPKTSEWSLTSKAGKTLANFGKDYWDLKALEGTKVFLLRGRSGTHIVNRRGERQSIEGADSFRRVEIKDGRLQVEVELQPSIKVGESCSKWGMGGPKLYASASEARELVEREQRAWNEEKRREWERERASRPRRANEPVGISICNQSTYNVTNIVRHQLGLDLRVISSERGFLIN